MKTNLQSTRITVLLFALAILFNACKKDKIINTPDPVITSTKGVYMLCEGVMGQNNSGITYYDIATGKTETDIYKKVNGTSLGETANDLKQYGSKMYCVVAGIQGTKQSYVDIMDIKTAKSLKRISFNSATDGQMPRYIAFYKNKAYVSRYDGKVSRIDTASMAIDGEIMLSEGLEGLAVANGKLYVTNSSHPYYPTGAKNKVSVINLATFTKIKDIEVNNNPVRIAAAANGDLFVICWNDYIVFNDPSLDRISSTTDTKTASYNYDLGAITIGKDKAYVSKDVYSDPAVRTLNTADGTIGSSIITDGTVINTYYGITINAFNNEVMIADAENYNGGYGTAYCFGTDGRKKFSFTTIGLPQHAVFLYNYK